MTTADALNPETVVLLKEDRQAVAALPTLRAMASAELQNLVLELGGDIRIIPAVTPTGGQR